MANSLDSVTASTKLRKEVDDVKEALDRKRTEYRERMDRVKDREEHLKVRRAELQERLIQFYKFIQDNEIKRARANKKATSEEKTKQERHGKIVELSEQLKQLELRKHESREKYQRYVKYEKYLTDVLQHGDQDEYQDATGIIQRWQTLEDNKAMLQKRKNDLETELEKRKTTLSMKRQRKKNDAVDLQNQLSELQNRLETLQKSLKKGQDELDDLIGRKSDTTTIIGQVRMACENLYEKCVAENSIYKARGLKKDSKDKKGEQQDENNDAQLITAQLTVIGDCLQDYQAVLQKHRERQRDKAAQQGANETAVRRAPAPKAKPSQSTAKAATQ